MFFKGNTKVCIHLQKRALTGDQNVPYSSVCAVQQCLKGHFSILLFPVA